MKLALAVLILRTALLGLALLVVGTTASAQVTTIPIKVQFTWNTCTSSDSSGNCLAYAPITGNNFVAQQLMSIDHDPFTNQIIGQNWFQFCNAPLDSTGTATCNFQADPTGLTVYSFQLLNSANNTPFCDTSHHCFMELDFDKAMVDQAASSATAAKPLSITIRMSSANNSVASFKLN